MDLSQVDILHLFADPRLQGAGLKAVLKKRAQNLAATPEVALEGEQLSILLFYLGEELYGLEIKYIRGIHSVLPLTYVPRTPEFVSGLMMSRGQLISVIDLPRFLGLSRESGETYHNIVVLHHPETGMEVGVWVSDVEDIVMIYRHMIEPVVVAQMGQRASYTLGVTAEKQIILDIDLLLRDGRLIVAEEI